MLEIESIKDGIRQQDGLYSVYNIIKFCGVKSEHKVFKRMCDKYPEVLTKCQTFKFPGRGQQNTPVANKENMLYIIGLLPGAIGKKYREESAKLVVKFLENPEELANDVLDRLEAKNDKEALKRISTRANSKVVRLDLSTVVFEHVTSPRIDRNKLLGWTTNNIYLVFYEKKAKQLKADRGLKKSKLLRDSFSVEELIDISAVEQKLAKKIIAESITDDAIPVCATNVAQAYLAFKNF